MRCKKGHQVLFMMESFNFEERPQSRNCNGIEQPRQPANTYLVVETNTYIVVETNTAPASNWN
jgi:hypothetical protein